MKSSALRPGASNRFSPDAKAENNLSREYEQVAFSPDGKWLAAGYGDSVQTWRRSGESFTAGASIEKIDLGSVFSLTFSPASDFLLTGHFRHIRAWKISADLWWEEATITPHHGGVMDMKLSQDGSKLAIAGIGDANGFGLWSVMGVEPSAEGRLFSLLKGRLSAAQKKFFGSALAEKIILALDPKDLAPWDMFETTEEYNQRKLRAERKASALFQEETERRYRAVQSKMPGTLYEVTVPLQTQGKYSVESKTYTFRFMDAEATAALERDPARELFRNWEKAGVRSARVETPEGFTYADFRLVHPTSGKTYPVGLAQNPFTGEKLDRYGIRVPSVAVGPDLVLRDFSIDGIFPSLFRYYGENPLGRVTFQNAGSSTISKLSASFFIPGLMRVPTRIELPEILGVGRKADAEIHAIIDTTVLNQAEGSSVTAELTVDYLVGGKPYHETIVRSVGLLHRNAIRWDDDKKVGAFMSLNDPALLRFSGRTAGLLEALPTDLLTGNFLQGLWFFTALKESGVRYVVDPASSYAALSRDKLALDFVRFPVETLDAKAGDCDDLSVLFNTLLESVGVRTAYITTPGHIFTAFDVGLSQEAASLAFGRPEDFILKDEKVWLPIETTLLTEGFTKAWQTAAREWKTAGAGAEFFQTETAWKKYVPVGFSAQAAVPNPSGERMKAVLNQELERWREIAMKPREKELLDLLERASTPGRENRLGILYGRFGLFEKALERFEKAGKEYIPALVNAANLLSYKKDFPKAKDYFLRALEKDAKNSGALSGLAFVYFETGDKKEAESLLARLKSIDPVLAAAPQNTSGSQRASGMGPERGVPVWQEDGSK